MSSSVVEANCFRGGLSLAIISLGEEHCSLLTSLASMFLLVSHWLFFFFLFFAATGPKLAEASRVLVQEDHDFISQVNAIALQLSHFQPLLLLTWSETLLYCRFDRWSYWNQLLQSGHYQVDESKETQQMIGPATLSCRRSHRILQRGALTLFSHLIVRPVVL